MAIHTSCRVLHAQLCAESVCPCVTRCQLCVGARELVNTASTSPPIIIRDPVSIEDPPPRGHDVSETLFILYLSIRNLFFKDFIYLFMRDTEREAETQAEGEAGSLQGARCRTGSWDPGITPWAKGRCSTTEPPQVSLHQKPLNTMMGS